MFLTEILNKKLINIYDGEILGRLGDADLLINENNGSIEAVIVPLNKNLFIRNQPGSNSEKQIPWSAVKKMAVILSLLILRFFKLACS